MNKKVFINIAVIIRIAIIFGITACFILNKQPFLLAQSLDIIPKQTVAPGSSSVATSEERVGTSEVQKTDIEIKSGSPHVLADGETSIILSSTGSLNGIVGRPKIRSGNNEFYLVSRTVIANKGFVFDISISNDCKIDNQLVGDVGTAVIGSCRFIVVSRKEEVALVKSEKLYGILDFDIMAPIYYSSIDGLRTSPIQKVHGEGQHFIGIRVVGAEYFKTTSSENVFVHLELEVITNFGVRKISVVSGEKGEGGYKQEEVVNIGPERITVKLLSFKKVSYKTVEEVNKAKSRGDSINDSVKLSVSVDPIRNEEEPVIIEYNEGKVQPISISINGTPNF